MPDVNEIKELGEKLDTVLKAANDAQVMAKDAEKKCGDIDSRAKESISKAAEASTKAAEDLQEFKLKVDAVEKTQAHLEKQYARMGSGGDDNETKEFAAKASDQMARYLKRGTPIDDDVIVRTSEMHLKQSLIGVSDAVRDRELKTMIAGNDPSGGYFTTPQMSATMITRQFETSPITSLANTETSMSDKFTMPIDDDEAGSGGWVEETETRTNTDTPGIGMLTILMNEEYAQPRATQKMLDNGFFNIEQWLIKKVTDRLSRDAETAFVTGDNVGKPRGFTQLPDWTTAGTYERGAIEQIASGASGEFTANGIKQLQNSMIEFYQPNAVFGIQRSAWSDIITIKDGTGRYLINPDSMRQGDDLIMLGKRVVMMHDMPAVGVGTLSMVYADFSTAYTVVFGIGIRVIRDNLTEKPYIKFYTTRNVGGDVSNYEALKLQKLSVS